MLTRLKNTNILYRRLLVVGLLIVLAGWAKFNMGRFPYTGTWVGYSYFRERGFARISLSFNADNSCSWQSDTYIKGNFSVTNFPCSYKMNGNSANIEVRAYDNQFYKNKWRVAITEKEKSQAPLIIVKIPVEVTPQKDGQILLGESPKTEFAYQGTDTNWSDSETRQLVLRKVMER